MSTLRGPTIADRNAQAILRSKGRASIVTGLAVAVAVCLGVGVFRVLWVRGGRVAFI